MLWTHRGKKYHLRVTAKWVSIAELWNTVALCFHFLFPGTQLVLWLEVGLGRWMTSPVVLTFEFWHSGTLCSYPPPTSRHLLSEAWIVLGSAFSFPPQRIPPFLCGFLSSCLRKKWRKWHSISWWMALDPWNPFLWGSHGDANYINQRISRMNLFTSGKNKWCEPSAPLRCCKWRLNIC